MPTKTLATVYQYRQVDPVTNRVILSFCKMRAEAIADIGAQLIADTAEEVWEETLDSQGKYYHRGKRARR